MIASAASKVASSSLDVTSSNAISRWTGVLWRQCSRQSLKYSPQNQPGLNSVWVKEVFWSLSQ